MLTSSALVLMMTGPGLALFYCGLVRRKNVLATMMQSFILMAVVSVVWAIIGYSLAFAEGNAVHRRVALRLPARGRRRARASTPPTIPHTTWMVYQLHVRDHHAGPDLRRLRRADEVQRDAALLRRCWLLVVYCPMAHMVWGKGGLFNAFMPDRAERPAPWTSPAGRSCTSAPACRRWSVRWCWASGAGYGQQSDAAAQRGAERDRRGPAVGRLVRLQRRQRAGGQRRWRAARSSRRTSPPPRRRWAGCSSSGSRPASRPCWARSPAPSPAWS